MTLNRGEGGQNKVGSNLFDVLGVLRTLELSQPRTAITAWSSVSPGWRTSDFPRMPEETFQKWQGHDIALGDMVRVIRTFRPDILWSPAFAEPTATAMDITRLRRLLPRKRFARPLIPTDFPSRSRRSAALAGEESLHRKRLWICGADLSR